jgi:ABC-type sugar transport system ATPase subunit
MDVLKVAEVGLTEVGQAEVGQAPKSEGRQQSDGEGRRRSDGERYILQGISFTQAPLQKIAIAGATGSGKTTLMKIIAGLIQADTGEVFFENKRVKGPAGQLIPGFPGIAYLSQHFELRNNYRVEEILEYANRLPAAEKLYEICRIGHLLRRRTDQLSGGERQRIALARLLSTSPRLLLLDEPYSNLDPEHRNNLKAVVREIGEKLNITCMLVSHDPVDSLSWADEILVLEQGRMVQKDKPERIYRQPANEYTAGLFGGYNVLTPPQAVLFQVKPGIFRPEDFKLRGEGEGGVMGEGKGGVPGEGAVLGEGGMPGGKGVTGEVGRVSFAGRCNEVEVVLPGFQITVSVQDGRYAKGDRVSISIDHDNYHP